jgi:hypothetical protein
MRLLSGLAAMAAAAAIGAAPADAQREHTRPGPRRSTAVTEAQATELTLTLTEAAVRSIQIWVRAGGSIDDSKTRVTALVGPAEASYVSIGQRVRVFSPDTRSRMYQGRVARVARQDGHVAIDVRLMGRAFEASRYYVVEIVTEHGDFFSVPNEAIIEADGMRIVYVREADGRYAPREIESGVQGELYTEILGGLEPGEQVVTFGSFFIDAEHKLKGP